MTVNELIGLLQDCDPEAEVRIMSQESWPFENAIRWCRRAGTSQAKSAIATTDSTSRAKQAVPLQRVRMASTRTDWPGATCSSSRASRSVTGAKMRGP